MSLNQVLKLVWSEIPMVKALTINVERPLKSGAKLLASADTGIGNRRIVIPHSTDLVRALNDFKCDGPWNRMTIVMRSSKSIKITTMFDADLQQSTMERIK